MLDAAGKQIGKWDSEGISALGKLESKNSNDGRAVIIQDGFMYICDASGKKTGRISYYNSGITVDSLDSSGNALARLTMSNSGNVYLVNLSREGTMSIGGGKLLSLSGDTIEIGNGLTGTAEFSDGSYLTFEGGILTGGRTKDGGTF